MSETQDRKRRIVVLGGGFGGVFTAMHLEKKLRRDKDTEIVLLCRENYFVFQPLLPEIVSGNIGLFDTVSPLRRLLKRTTILVREIDEVDLEKKTVTLAPGFRPRQTVLDYDHLVLALGTVTDFRSSPGLHEHALRFKNLADAVQLRNHLIHVLEEATIEKDPELRRQLLTFVVGGGGFSGVEVCAELNDFLRRATRKEYRSINDSEIRVMLVHSGGRVLEREVGDKLALYAQSILVKRGIELRLHTRLDTATPDAAVLSGGERIPTKTVISTVPSSPNPLIETLDLPTERGRLKVDKTGKVEGRDDIWGLGDCVVWPHPDGHGVCPPTAQYAVRQGELLAHNITAQFADKPLKEFGFTGLGKMGSLGHRSAVALLFDKWPVSGMLAWFMWRSVYWMKLPGIDRKMRVAISWMLDLFFPPDTVQLRVDGAQSVAHVHYQPGETIFREGDLGDSFFIVLEGEVEVVREKCDETGDCEKVLAHLGPGQYFGEMALLHSRTRTATIRCTKPTRLLSLKQRDFGELVANLPELKHSFEKVADERVRDNSEVAAETPGGN